jgi:hypothetical protein
LTKLGQENIGFMDFLGFELASLSSQPLGLPGAAKGLPVGCVCFGNRLVVTVKAGVVEVPRTFWGDIPDAPPVIAGRSPYLPYSIDSGSLKPTRLLGCLEYLGKFLLIL